MALRKWFSPSNLMRRSKAAADWGALPKPNENGHRIPSGRCGLILSEILMLLEWMWPTVGHFWILNITIPPILWFGVFLICCFFHRASCDGPIHRCHPISRKTGFSEAKPGYRYVKPGKPGFPDKPYFFPGFSRSRYVCMDVRWCKIMHCEYNWRSSPSVRSHGGGGSDVHFFLGLRIPLVDGNGLPFLWLGDPPLKHPSVGGPKIQIHPETSPCYWALGGFCIALAALLMLSRGAVQAVQGLVPNAGVHHVPRRTRKGPPRHSRKSMEIQNGRNPRPIKHWICFGAQTNSIMKRVNTG